jgi:murein DD-endopeptidase MepM/ murein hydrolase activator NlpD
MRQYSVPGLVPALATVVVAGSVWPASAPAPEPPPPAVRQADVELVPDMERLTGVIANGTTLGAMLERYDVVEMDRLSLVSAIQEIFDVRRVRTGQPFAIDRLFDGRVRAFEYEIDGDRRLVARARPTHGQASPDAVAEPLDTPARASLDVHAQEPEPDRRSTSLLGSDGVGLEPAPRFIAWIEAIEKDVELTAVEGEIDREHPSLTQALDAAGERLDLALQLADVFSGEIDFSSELQPGDRFRLVVERHSREGAHAGYGPILAAEFVASGRALQAYRFSVTEGKPAYYDAEGRSLKRFFLKSPLKFEPRITSRFSSARRHPILNYTRAHNGVDYSAPTGAPVVTVAPGVVTLAGWTGGGGRTVRVRHANGYESEYLHLSAITVRTGTRVSQGDLVGRVGATGLATGPHLHYGLRKNGRYVNPVVEHRNMPPGDPVPAAELAVFSIERDRLFGLFSTVRPRAAN